MRETQQVRIGIIGAGANTRSRHIPGFQQIEGVEVVAACNRSRESGEKVASACGIPRVLTDWRELTNDPEVDAVCIGTWPNLHAEATIAALEAGKHVLCEARMARNLAEAHLMQAAAEAHPDLVLQIVPSPFTLNLDDRIRSMLAAGELGDIREVRILLANDAAADPATPLGWRFDHEISGMNTMMLGIFHEAVQRWLPGEPEWLQADAAIYTPMRRDPATGEAREVRIPEVLTVLGGYTSGTRLFYHFSGIETNEPVQQIRLNGSKACLDIYPAEDRIEQVFVGTSERETIEIAEPEKRGWRVEEDFIASIREGKPVLLTHPSQGVRYMEFTERVWRSWTEGGTRIGRL